jgi:hypothetical protein
MTREQLLNRLFSIDWNRREINEAYLLAGAGLRTFGNRRSKQKDQETTK